MTGGFCTDVGSTGAGAGAGAGIGVGVVDTIEAIVQVSFAGWDMGTTPRSPCSHSKLNTPSEVFVNSNKNLPAIQT